MRTAGVRTLVFSSTAAVYGEPESVPIAEDARDRADQPLRRHQTRRGPHDQRRVRRPRPGRGLLRYFNVAGAYTAGRPYGERHDPEST